MKMQNITLSNIIAETGVFIDGDWVESKDQDPNGEVRLIQLADIGDGIFINKSNRFLTKEKALKLKCTFLQKGDLLIARMPDPLGRACVFPGNERECVTVVDVCIIRPNSKDISNEYLKYHINNPDFRNRIIVYVTGTTRKRISRSNLDKIHFDLPAYDDQIRIATVLSRAEKLIAKRKESIKALDELLKSSFLEMFGDPVRNEKGWELERLDQISKLERGRFSPRPRNDPSYYDGIYPFIQTGDISNSCFRLNKYNQTLNDRGIKVSKKFKKGLIVIAIVGATIGATAILEIDVYATDSIIGITPHENKTNSIFLEFVMRYWRPVLIKNAPEAARANINLEILNRLMIFAPPLTLQNQFAGIVEKVETLKGKYTQSLTELDNLYGSLSQRAFKGELDLSKIPVEKEKQIVELHGKKEMVVGVNK